MSSPILGTKSAFFGSCVPYNRDGPYKKDIVFFIAKELV
jgi:hypothetical protein